MSRLEEALGNRAVRELSELVGGVSLRIPPLSGGERNADARRKLVALVGTRLAEDLITHFARTRVYVPRGVNSRPISRATVLRLTRKGWSATRIAAELGCCDRTVHAKRTQARNHRKGK